MKKREGGRKDQKKSRLGERGGGRRGYRFVQRAGGGIKKSVRHTEAVSRRAAWHNRL